MKVTVKTLNGNNFQISVHQNDTILAVKKQIENIQGKYKYPCGQQLLIHNGKFLKDESSFAENNVVGDGFHVVMLSKNKCLNSSGSTSSQPATTVTEELLPPPTPKRYLASMANNHFAQDSFNLRGSNNPDRAVNFYYSPAPIAAPSSEAPNSCPFNLFPRDSVPDAGIGSLGFLRNISLVGFLHRDHIHLKSFYLVEIHDRINGHNGTINGQGQAWWNKYRKKLLNHTRGPLVQLMWSRDIYISDVTLRDSPFWTLHPYDCQNITIRNVTILAPLSDAPNTDGIDPDSCENMVVEDSYISVGDDGIAIKSGWDQYGIAYARPSTNIIIRNVTVRSMISAGVSIGSEMSGGVSNITVENLLVWNSKRGIRIKTSAGRGGYVRQITYRNLTLQNVRVGIVIKTDYNEHPDEGYDPNTLPVIEDINFDGIRGHGVRIPCSSVQGRVIGKIFPRSCENLDVYDEKGNLIKKSTSQNSTDVDYDP